MIRLEHVSKVFQPGTPNENAAIRDVNLTVKEGEFIAIIQAAPQR